MGHQRGDTRRLVDGEEIRLVGVVERGALKARLFPKESRPWVSRIVAFPVVVSIVKMSPPRRRRGCRPRTERDVWTKRLPNPAEPTRVPTPVVVLMVSSTCSLVDPHAVRACRPARSRGRPTVGSDRAMKQLPVGRGPAGANAHNAEIRGTRIHRAVDEGGRARHRRVQETGQYEPTMKRSMEVRTFPPSGSRWIMTDDFGASKRKPRLRRRARRRPECRGASPGGQVCWHILARRSWARPSAGTRPSRAPRSARAAGVALRIDRPIDKDAEMHPLVRWQFVGVSPKRSARRFCSPT